MKRLLILLFAFCTLTLSAQSPKNLYVVQGPDSEKELKLTDISKITFNQGNIQIAMADGSTNSYAISSVVRLYFADASGVPSLKAPQSALWSPATAQLTLDCAPGTKVRIFNAGGQCVATAVQTLAQSPIDLSSLPAGLYIVEAGGNTVKIMR